MLLSGTIIIWSGPIETIPVGWFLCNGNNGTPNLLKRFIIGAGSSYSPNDSGGQTFHQHDFTTDYHGHDFISGSGIHAGSPFSEELQFTLDTGQTELTNAVPAFYTLAFIMLGY